jgi:hypothetical protein
MSKLAHSHQPTMDELDRKRAIENGDEDLLPQSTPGPWHLLDIEGKEAHVFAADNYQVADCESYKRSSAECLANAKLIAAMPDLLALAIKTSELVNCGDGILSAEGRCNELLCEIIRMVPASIIAKATKA